MRNVLGMIPGKNTKEYVIVGAHFDHLGIDPALDGDQSQIHTNLSTFAHEVIVQVLNHFFVATFCNTDNVLISKSPAFSLGSASNASASSRSFTISPLRRVVPAIGSI